MTYKYTFNIAGEGIETARAVGLNLPISFKHAVEVCNMVRGLPVEKAKEMLEAVINEKLFVPFRRYNSDLGHKKGHVGAGKHPIKACTHILSIIKSAESNASDKGLLSEGLVITSIVSHKASSPPSYGRQRGRKSKRTHIEVVLKEEVVVSTTEKPQKDKKPAPDMKKEEPKSAKKPEEKPEAKQK